MCPVFGVLILVVRLRPAAYIAVRAILTYFNGDFNPGVTLIVSSEGTILTQGNSAFGLV